jgi:hypothetical protein
MNKGRIVSTISRSDVGNENELEEHFFAVTGAAE